VLTGFEVAIPTSDERIDWDEAAVGVSATILDDWTVV